MSTSLTSDFETPRASRRGKAEKVAFVAAKLAVTGACLWYVSRQIEWQQGWSAIPLLDFRGAGLAVLIALGFVILLLPLGFTAVGEYRESVLLIYGGLIFAGVLGLLLAPTIVAPLDRWRYSRWLAALTADVHRVLLGPKGPMI